MLTAPTIRAPSFAVLVEIGERREPGLALEAFKLAREFGWAKTYDAEYVALARLLGCRLVTLDYSCAAAQTGSAL